MRNFLKKRCDFNLRHFIPELTRNIICDPPREKKSIQLLYLFLRIFSSSDSRSRFDHTRIRNHALRSSCLLSSGSRTRNIIPSSLRVCCIIQHWYYLSKKSCPIFLVYLIYRDVQDFLGIQYNNTICTIFNSL